jgi:HK97 gp10 family phage protein
MKIEVEGLTDLQTALRELGDPRAIKTALRASLRKAARPMLEAARARVPVDKGDLKRSVKIAAAKGERLDSLEFGVVIGIDANEQPARYVVRKTKSDGGRGGTYRDPGVAGVAPITEFGRPGQAAEPFMRPAFDTEGEATIRRFGEVAGAEIERVATRLAKKRGAG